MRGFGVDVMFTLNGGHIWPLYEACRNQGVRVVDTRHEQSATFAAEAYAKLTRRPGVAALDRRPGHHQRRLGRDVGVVQRLAARRARRPGAAGAVGRGVAAGARPRADPRVDHEVGGDRHDAGKAGAMVHDAIALAAEPHRGPVFLDFPLDVFGPSAGDVPAVDAAAGAAWSPTRTRSPRSPRSSPAPSGRCSSSAATSTGPAPRRELAAAVEHLRVPVFTNGLGRGTLPADHELAFLRTRALLKQRADVVVVLGTPLDFRLGFGRFGEATVAHVVDAESQRAAHVDVLTVAGDIAATLRGLAEHTRPRADHEAWIAELRAAEEAARGRRGAAARRVRRRRSSRPGCTASCAGGWRAMPS